MEDRKPFAVVIGAAGGIGRKTASLLLKRGYRTAGLDRKHFEIPGVEAAVLDITDREVIRSYTESLDQAVDVLVVSAAVHSTHPVEYLTDELVDSVLDVNLLSHIKLVRDFLPRMADRGSIVGVSSIAACIGVPMSSLYSASKSGLEGFYESLRTEVACRGIRVSVVHPGNVNTGFNETGNTYEPRGNPGIDGHYADVVRSIDSSLGIDPNKVAEVTLKVIGKRNPRFCYIVGMNARKANWAKKLLGRDLAIKLMGKFFGF
jgi:NAD(P)-dependent dehydrogenase (short-subunit alcohol dehydrogenase family)